MYYRISKNEKNLFFGKKIAQVWAVTLNVIWQIESNIRALVLLNLLNLMRKRDKMLGKPHILSLSLNSFNKLNKTWALM